MEDEGQVGVQQLRGGRRCGHRVDRGWREASTDGHPAGPRRSRHRLVLHAKMPEEILRLYSASALQHGHQDR